MLDINWGDVLNILNNVKPYLIGVGVVVVLAIIASTAVRKKDKPVKKLVRAEAILASLVAIIIAANGIVFGPMFTIINLAMGDGTLTEETLEAASNAAEEIAGEGMVLLKNEDNMLPLTNTSNLNVFGWASTNPCYGGTGSGALNDNYDKVTLLQGLENAGFSLNTELSDFYTEYTAEHPTISPFTQDWTLPEPPANTYSDSMIANTWNKDMAYKFGDGIGQMAEEMNVSGWYAPAMNTHRAAFGGRNFNYFNADQIIRAGGSAQLATYDVGATM